MTILAKIKSWFYCDHRWKRLSKGHIRPSQNQAFDTAHFKCQDCGKERLEQTLTDFWY